MRLVRPVQRGDIDALYSVADAIGKGMTTFPADRDTIAAKVEASIATFDLELEGPERQMLLVLEDFEQGSAQVTGVSAVYPQIGHPYGFFSFHIDRLIQFSSSLSEDRNYTTATLSNAYTGLTEVGTLAVHPQLRSGGAGRLLAQARYVLMACFPELFADKVIAELRGRQDADGKSPFWSALGERFFGLDFPDADLTSAIRGNAFIADLMPKLPIYLDLLPQEAIDAVGRPHDVSAIAMRMLQQEGFRYEGFVDIFDAGPQLACETKDIKTVAATRRATIGACARGLEHPALLTNPELKNFGITPTQISHEDTLVAEEKALGLLGLDIGDEAMVTATGLSL